MEKLQLSIKLETAILQKKRVLNQGFSQACANADWMTNFSLFYKGFLH